MLKYIEDYYDKVHERFPDLEMWEIEKILKHGMQSFFTLTGRGADLFIKSPKNNFFMYCGKAFNSDTLFYRYQAVKLRIKYRLKYSFKKPLWDGNYYLGLTEEEYNKYMPKKSGRYKYKVTFDKVKLYKIKEENYIQPSNKYFFAIKFDEEAGWTKELENFSTRNITLYAKRNKEGKIEEI